MAEVLNVTVRENLGTRASRRLRGSGQIPLILYGHGKEVVSLAAPSDEVSAAIRHGAHLVDLKGAAKDSALIREVQWDAFGIDVLHLDLTRVKAGEQVEITVRVEVRGRAPGVNEGGVVSQPRHEVQIECPVTNIPDKFELNINSLELGQTMTAASLELPEGAKLLSEADLVLVQCVLRVEEDEEESEEPTTGSEPEVIGRKAEDEEGGSED